MGSTRVGAMLLEADLIDSAQLRRALEHQQHRGGRTVGILVELGMLEHDQVYKFLARRGLPAMNPMHCGVGPEAISLLPREFVLRHEIIPVDRLGRLLTVAMVYPFDADAIACAEEITGLRVKPMLCRTQEFQEAVCRYYPGELGPYDGLSRAAARANTDLAQRSLARVRELGYAPITRHTRGRLALLDAARGLTVERAAAILSRDPVALARVLAEANAREWTRRRPILDRFEAIRRLGMGGVIEALEALETWEARLRQADAVFTQWRATAVAVAETASNIAKVHAVAGAPGVYEAALLHNLGVLALLMIDTQNYPAAFDVRPIERRREREREVYGITDSEAGAELARAWELPAPIAVTIEHLLAPEGAPSSHDTVAVVALAHHIVQMECNLETDCTEALRILGLTQSNLRSTVLQLHAKTHAGGVEI